MRQVPWSLAFVLAIFLWGLGSAARAVAPDGPPAARAPARIHAVTVRLSSAVLDRDCRGMGLRGVMPR